MLRQPGAAHQRFFAFLQNEGTGFLGHEPGAVLTVGFDPTLE